MKPQSFTIHNLQSYEGTETIAFNCHLMYEKRKVATVKNAGTGNGNEYTWENQLVEQEFRAAVTDELVWDLLEDKLPELSQDEIQLRLSVGR
ncbi:hypothetical protein [Allocoleopsis sp.]|uniref:hypothetical protein n=1 Tax=Allocoleopsis sp. TaxID=3088169 RepID=UPI002FCEB6F4